MKTLDRILIFCEELWYFNKYRSLLKTLVSIVIGLLIFFQISKIYVNFVEKQNLLLSQQIEKNQTNMILTLNRELDILYEELNCLSSQNMRQDSSFFAIQAQIFELRKKMLKSVRKSPTVVSAVDTKYPSLELKIKFRGPKSAVKFLESRTKYITSDDISPEFRLIQAAVETGWGQSELSSKHYNDFGQKWHVVKKWKPEWIKEGRVYKVHFYDDCGDDKCTFVGFKNPGDSWILNEVHLKNGYNAHKVSGSGKTRAKKTAEKMTKYATGSGYIKKLQNGVDKFIDS